MEWLILGAAAWALSNKGEKYTECAGWFCSKMKPAKYKYCYKCSKK